MTAGGGWGLPRMGSVRPSIMMRRFLEDLMKGHWEEIHDLLTSPLGASQSIMEGQHHTEVYCSGLIYWPFPESL